MTTLERFLASIPDRDPSACWPWEGALTAAGYGVCGMQVDARRSSTSAHRAVWLATGRTIAEGLQLDHLCRVRACCNPNHLEPVTAKANVGRSPLTNATKTACPAGHTYDKDNTEWYAPPGSTPRRFCIACRRARRKAAR